MDQNSLAEKTDSVSKLGYGGPKEMRVSFGLALVHLLFARHFYANYDFICRLINILPIDKRTENKHEYVAYA